MWAVLAQCAQEKTTLRLA